MSIISVKLDENMAQTHVEFLQQAGYNADRVTDEGLSGANDDIIWQQVCAEKRFFITLDLDLGYSPLSTRYSSWYTARAFA